MEESPLKADAIRQRNLNRLLLPENLVFIGGARAAGAIEVARSMGYGGRIYAVNPKADQIAGVPTFKRVSDLPEPPDAAFVAVSGTPAIEIISELRQVGAGGVACYASGFAEAGSDGERLQQQLIEHAGDLALIGPNCFGVINYVNGGHLWPLRFPQYTGPRGVSVVSQSGNLCINLANSQRSIPWNHLVSIGNQAVLGVEDLMLNFANDPLVKVIGVYLEGLRDVRAFHEAALYAADRGIPIVVLKSGSSQAGAEAVMSHTSSLAGSEEMYNALFERTGIIRSKSLPEMEETLKLLAISGPPKGRRVVAFTSSGGDAGLTADIGTAEGLEFAGADRHAREATAKNLPDYMHVGNPLDFGAVMWGQEEPLRRIFTDMIESGCDSTVLVADAPSYDQDSHGSVGAMVRALASASKHANIPSAHISINPESMPKAMREGTIDLGVTPLQGLQEAMRAIAGAAGYSEWRERVSQVGRPHPLLPVVFVDEDIILLDEHRSKAALENHGLRCPERRICSRAELANCAEAIGFPVVVKALSEHLPHKTEVGGIVVGIHSAAAAEEAGRQIAEAVSTAQPHIEVSSFIVERMASKPVAELIVGVKRDPIFGLALIIGVGGTMVELLRETTTLLLPVNRSDVKKVLTTGILGKLMSGFRGTPVGDIEAATEAIMAIVRFAEANSQSIVELDVNPLMTLPIGHGALAVDALISCSRLPI